MESVPKCPVQELALTQGIVRARSLAELGVSGATLQQILRKGGLVRIGRGLYASPDRTVTELDHLAQIAIKHPRVVFCLLTALQVHGLTTQSPSEVWVAISPKARVPKYDFPPLRIVRMSDPGDGITQVAVDGVVHIPVTSIAKTVADCFKFRNKIGLDVALEALRDAWNQKRVTMDELWESAEICRMTNVMRPYLESLV
jgi:predicted transcriptional regulator of viral defense system